MISYLNYLHIRMALYSSLMCLYSAYLVLIILFLCLYYFFQTLSYESLFCSRYSVGDAPVYFLNIFEN